MQKKDKNRKRCLIVNFRMSQEEREALDERIKLSGLKKQDYMVRSTLYQKIVVVGNEKMFAKVVDQLEQIREEMCRINDNSEIKVNLLVPLRTVCEVMEGLGYGSSIFNEENERS